jgi:hypothetical protein
MYYYKFNKNMKKYLIIPTVVMLFLVSIFALNSIDNFSSIKKFIPSEVRQYIKKLLISKDDQLAELNRLLNEKYIHIDELKKYIQERDERILRYTKTLDDFKLKEKEHFPKFIKEYSRNYINNSQELSFVKLEDKFYNVNNKQYRLSKFYFPWLNEAGIRFYIKTFKDDLFLITGNGNLIFANLDEFKQNKVDFKKIKLSFPKNFILDDHPIVKDFLFFENKIYISYLSKNEDNCVSNSIAVGNFDYNNILLDEFLRSNDCNYKFSAQSGGKLSIFKENKILFSIGDAAYWEEWKFNTKVRNLIPFDPKKSYDASQSLDSHLGKVISIDLNTKDIEIMSMGHRNVQGIYFDKENDKIFLSEHGPMGGDEINLIDLKNNQRNKNYGWPISSYGEHYKKNDEIIYKYAPLKKSHKNFGF